MAGNSTLLLDASSWDWVVDASGNWAVAGPPYSQAQDAASAIRLFLGELYYDTAKGVPYARILAKPPNIPVLKSYMVAAALSVPGIVSAVCFITAISERFRPGPDHQFQRPDGGGGILMSTNVPPISYGSNGFTGPSTTQVLTGVIADIQAAFGNTLNLSIDNTASLATSQGQLATSMTGSIVSANNAFLIQSTQTDPAYAFGRWQDAIGRIYFMERLPSEPTALQIACNGAQNVVIPINATVIDPSGNIYSCTQAGTIPVGGSIMLAFACSIPGPIAVPATVVPYQTIPGWDRATIVSGVLGRNVESRAA